MAAIGCIQWSGISARRPGALAGFCLDKGLSPRQVRNTRSHLRDFQYLLATRLGVRWNGPPMRGGQRGSMLAPRGVFCLLLCLFLTLPIQAQTQFVDVTAAAGIDASHRGIWDPDEARQGYLAIGQAWGDFDGDGWAGLLRHGQPCPQRLYRNLGEGRFALSEHSALLSLPDVPSGGATFADF